MLRKSGATAGKIWKNTIEQEHICDDCSSCFSPCFTLKRTKSISLADLPSMTYPKIFAQQPGETSHCYALFLDGSRSCCSFRVTSSAPEARRRCIRRLGKAMPPWSSCWSLRGPRWTWPTTTAVAPEGFSGRFGSGSDEVMEGVRTLAGDFCPLLWDVEWYSYVLFKDPLVWWDGPIEIRVKEMRWND